MKDVKIKLSALWVALVLSTFLGDVLRLMDPGIIAEESMVSLTHEIFLLFAIIYAIPIFMVFLSLELKYKANRWANIIFGIFFFGFNLIFLIGMVARSSPGYDIFLGIVYPVFAALIVWYAWKWPKQEG